MTEDQRIIVKNYKTKLEKEQAKIINDKNKYEVNVELLMFEQEKLKQKQNIDRNVELDFDGTGTDKAVRVISSFRELSS